VSAIPFEESTQLGPLANADAVASLDAAVKKVVAAGARVLTGGHPLSLPGCFYAPTVLTDIPKDSPAYSEEFFGPVASIFRVKDCRSGHKDRQRRPLRAGRKRLDQRSRGNGKIHQ
jgi:acyl-CoA reductase-like NAD-dependent aldehyde dehydrogenase